MACRRSGTRRKQLDLSGKPLHSLRASRLRRGRMHTRATRKPLFELHRGGPLKPGPEGMVPREVEDAEYLQQVSDRVQLSEHPISARWVSLAQLTIAVRLMSYSCGLVLC